MLLVKLCRGTDFSGIERQGGLGQCPSQCPAPRASTTPQARKEEALFALGQNQHSRSDPRALTGSPASFRVSPCSLLQVLGRLWPAPLTTQPRLSAPGF